MHQERKATWWITWEDLNWPDHDNLDKIKARAEGLAKADVTAAMIFGTHFRWDYLPYFTILHDYLATVAEELHKNGVKLFDHHSVNLIHRYRTREEMRHVMLDSGPHLPFSPSWEAAATWEYQGKRLNDWRMIDVKTRQPLYYPQYAGEGFCFRNPDFVEAYCHYVKQLIADTGIDGLSADDPIHYRHHHSCACAYCRKALQDRSGIDLPPIEDLEFWGNWENPAWRDWTDLRFEAVGEFMSKLSDVLPENFVLTTCGASSSSFYAPAMATDARQFLRGSNYVNQEMSGNTPPYKHDPVTVNIPVSNRAINASHHQAAAREKGVRCFGTGFAFTTAAANHVWAVNKSQGADSWISTLKGRLGLPNSILKTLPEEKDIVGQAFGFERAHPQLFEGDTVGQLGVYFSYETRNHTYFGNLRKGYYRDYYESLAKLFHQGISPHTVFRFPESPEQYPLILLPSAASMTQEEQDALETYLAAGGKVVATGPCAISGCENNWELPTKPGVEPMEFFSSIRDGVWSVSPAWTEQELPAYAGENVWTQPRPGLWYNPHRMGDGAVTDAVLEYCRDWGKPMPVQIISSQGYLVSVFESRYGMTVHFLAADYDTDIDHHLDEIRFHRSRVNYINKVVPIGVSRHIRLAAEGMPQVWLPLNQGQAQVTREENVIAVTLPEDCSYVILEFTK